MKQNERSVIHIFGASGSGTTTLGRYIAEKLSYTLLDSDDYFWLPTDLPFTEKREAAERVRLMREDILKAGKAVVSGSLVDWGDALIPYFTLCIRLVTKTEIRIERLRQREWEHFGARIEPGGDMFQNHQEFLQWAAAYDTGDEKMRSRKNHDLWQRQLSCPLLVLDGAEPLSGNLARVREALNS